MLSDVDATWFTKGRTFSGSDVVQLEIILMSDNYLVDPAWGIAKVIASSMMLSIAQGRLQCTAAARKRAEANIASAFDALPLS